MNFIEEELDKMGIKSDKFEEIRCKDEIYLFRIYKKDHSYVLKYFSTPEGIREIRYYELLQKAGVPTLEILGRTERAILMEDMLTSPHWRLGTAVDLCDPSFASNLAQWYRTLHKAGKMILNAQTEWYSEYGLLTPENLWMAMVKTNTAEQKLWPYLIEHLPELHKRIRNLDSTVNYNDFYYTNLAVSRDGKEAMMFDYNCMGKGYAAADIRNVCWSLSNQAARAFRESYGNVSEYEYRVDDVVSVLTTLVMAAKRSEIPNWADGALTSLKSGKLEDDIRNLLSA